MERANINKFDVVLLGIIFDPKTKRILIGRREKDPYVPKLTWCFPGGRLGYNEDVEKTLVEKIKEKTGLKIENLGSIFARTLPEKKDFVMIYFLCEVVGGKEKAGGDFKELKWVKPEELKNHFTTSFHPHLKEYVMNLK
ncbi:NUDIX domain-containing protein [Candidatus Pacearchaeota archaeon]|nr:NUDIX domain-containing protein [Candidatus Pacearchaeota archaeon]